jgi:hypothetical protein
MARMTFRHVSLDRPDCLALELFSGKTPSGYWVNILASDDSFASISFYEYDEGIQS